MQGPPSTASDGTNIFVSNATDILDPFERAQGDVARSKEVIAATTKDLIDHDRWLKDYLASEKRSRKRHALYVRCQHARQRRTINRQRMARSGRRAALRLAISVRSTSRSLLKGATYRLARLRDLTLISASWVTSTTYVFSSWLLGQLFISLSWIGAKGRTLTLISLKAASISLSWIAVRARVFALASLRAASIASTWVASRARALAIVSVGAASAGFTLARAKSRDLARASLNAAAIGGSWLAARTNVLAIASSNATSSGVFWTMAKSHAFALQSRQAAAIGSSWTAANTRALVRASLSAASTGSYWVRAKSGDLALKLHHAGSMASPWIHSAAHGAAVRLLALSAATRGTAHLQSERAALLALRLTAQAKGEIDALRRAARSGELTPPAWRRFAAIASQRKGLVNGFEMEEEPTASKSGRTISDTEDATLQTGEYASRNALICVEPWRCRLPVVQTDRLGGSASGT